jgi:hypothetical protein
VSVGTSERVSKRVWQDLTIGVGADEVKGPIPRWYQPKAHRAVSHETNRRGWNWTARQIEFHQRRRVE